MPDFTTTQALPATFAPAWARRMAAEEHWPAAGTSMPLAGAILFADISGFTALADRMSQLGPAGVEELSRLLNDYFGQLLEQVAAFGGDAFNFAGDALMAIWPAADGDMAGAMQRAAACALAIPSRLQRYETPGGALLSLRIGVSLGPLAGVLLAAGDRVWPALLGTPLDDVVRALGRAQSGDVVLSPAAWAAIVARAAASPAGQGCWRLTRVDAMPSLPEPPQPVLSQTAARWLQTFVPGPVRERLAAGHGDWLGELRQVTAVFVNVGGLNHAAPQAAAQLQSVLEAAEPVVRRCGGQMHEIGIDDKGVVLVAVFGLPPLGHEDAAARAALAALELHSALGLLGYEGAVGVASGRCFCGVVGSQVLREYAIVGNTMNMAARLMEAAQSLNTMPRVLCESATLRSAEARVEFESLPPIAVKGKTQLMAVARPVGRRQQGGAAGAPMVGRMAEREVIRQAVQGCATDHAGGTLLIMADAGMGKSCLLRELVEQARMAGVAVWEGAADAIEAATPYFAWRRPVAAMLGVGGAEEDHAAALLHRLGPGRAARAPLLGAVLAVTVPDTPETAPLAGQQRAQATRELLLELLAEAAGTAPTALVLEDAHWFDAASWSLALEVARRVPQLLLVVSTRPYGEPEPAELGALRQAAATRHLTLGPLSDTEMQALVGARLGVAELPMDLQGAVTARAAGSPLFAEQLVSALLEAGVIEVRQGQCSMAYGVDLAALALPDTVQGVVSSRIDRLAPREALAIKVGSVIGTAFAVRLLADVYPVRDDLIDLDQVLQRLRDTDLTVLETPEPQLAYAFKHVITREVAYNLMLYAQRSQLHHAVAEWYEQRFGDERPELLALLAHHWARAGVVTKAVACLEKSAMRTFSMGLGRAAVDQGLEAARLLGLHLPTDPQAIRPLLGAELARIEQLRAGREPAALLDHWPMQEDEPGRIIGLLLRIMPFAHVSLQSELFALMSLRATSLTLLHGNGPAAPVVYAMHSIIHRTLTGDTTTAYRFAEMAVELDRRQGSTLMGPVGFIYTWFNQHWLRPVERALEISLQAAESAFTAGDVLYGCFNLAAHVVYLAAAGRPLPEVMAAAARHRDLIGARVHNAAFHTLQELQFAKALAGLTDSPTSMSDAEHDEARDVASICASDNYNQIAFYFVARLKLHYHFGEHAAALEFAAKAQALLPAIAGQTAEVELVFFHALALLARARELSPEAAAPLVEQARALHLQLRRWAELNEADFLHKALLVQAELAGDPTAHEQAAAAASAYMHHEALAHELHARALRGAGDTRWRDALARSRDAYARWGAHAKLAQLERF